MELQSAVTLADTVGYADEAFQVFTVFSFKLQSSEALGVRNQGRSLFWLILAAFCARRSN